MLYEAKYSVKQIDLVIHLLNVIVAYNSVKILVYLGDFLSMIKYTEKMV